ETNLGGLQHAGVGFAFACHVEQSEKETGRAGAQEIVKIASRARGKIGDGHVRAPKPQALCLEDFGSFLYFRAESELGKQRLHEGRNLAQTLGRGNKGKFSALRGRAARA